MPELVLPPVTIEGYPYPPSSGGLSSTVSEAKAENLRRGVQKLEAQEKRMTDVITKTPCSVVGDRKGAMGSGRGTQGAGPDRVVGSTERSG